MSSLHWTNRGFSVGDFKFKIGPRVKSLHQQKIEQCMRLGRQTVRDVPTMPDDPEERKRIVKLCVEEALELAEAMGVAVIADSAALITEARVQLDSRSGLSFEDTGETDLVKAADALADLSVVTGGGVGALGLCDVSLFDLIDDANLAKFDPPKCPKCQAPMEVQEKYRDNDRILRLYREWACTQDATHPVMDERAGPWIREDGKYMKPPYWQAPDVEGLLKQQAQQDQPVLHFDKSAYMSQEDFDKLTKNTPKESRETIEHVLPTDLQSLERRLWALPATARMLVLTHQRLGFWLGRPTPPAKGLTPAQERELLLLAFDKGKLPTLEQLITYAEQNIEANKPPARFKPGEGEFPEPGL